MRKCLALAYLIMTLAAAAYELNAYRFARQADGLKEAQKYQSAGYAYKLVIEKFPFSLSAVGARHGLEGISPALPRELAESRLCETWLETTVSQGLDPYAVDQINVVGWPVAGTMFLWVVVTRRRRKRIAACALLLGLAAAAGTVLALWYSGMVTPDLAGILSREIADFLPPDEVLHVAAWLALALAGLMTLTSRHRVPAVGSGANILALEPADLQSGDLRSRLNRLEHLKGAGTLSEEEYRRHRQRALESF